MSQDGCRVCGKRPNYHLSGLCRACRKRKCKKCGKEVTINDHTSVYCSSCKSNIKDIKSRLSQEAMNGV